MSDPLPDDVLEPLPDDETCSLSCTTGFSTQRAKLWSLCQLGVPSSS